MKVVILAGGLGTRLAEYTQIIPKPMIKIGNDPIVIHIMNHYLKYGLIILFWPLDIKVIILKNFQKF